MRSEISRQLDEWYSSPLGQVLADREQALLGSILPNLFGYHLLQVGTGSNGLVSASRILHKISMSSDLHSVTLAAKNHTNLCAIPEALPFLSDTLDAVLLNHVMEFSQDPRQLLREVDRVLVPEGHLVILGFNPYSLWGVRKLFTLRKKSAPWSGSFINLIRLKDWLALLGFEICSTQQIFFRPPVQHQAISSRLLFLESWGQRWWPFFGGVYVLVAKKKVSTLTPIRPRWRPRRSMVTGLADTASGS